MGRSCREIEALLDRRAGGLDEASRLLLEGHLVGCSSCRETAAMLRFVGQALGADQPLLSESARIRSIGRALDSTAFPVAERRTYRWLFPTATAAIAAAGVLAWSLTVEDAQPRAAARMPTASKSVPAAIRAPASESAATAANALHPNGGRKVDAAHVSDQAAEPAPLEVPAKDGVPGPQSSISRRRFAGEAVSVGGEAASASRELPVRVLAALAQARAALARNDTQAARQWITEAEAGASKRKDRAEAETLRAECSLLDHKPADAIKHYLSVASHYPELTAGENGLFAAAQLAARSHDQVREHELLGRYLTRYPRGRFADEARARLSAK